MTATIQLSRDTHVYIGLGAESGNEGDAGYQPNAALWKIPVLDGFSFSQATATTEVTLNEMQDASGSSNRGRAMFTNALEPAEWSFSTYARPIFDTSNLQASAATSPATGLQTAVEEALWALFFGAKEYTKSASGAPAKWHIDSTVAALQDKVVTSRGQSDSGSTSTLVLGSQDSNRAELGTFDLYFVLGGCAPGANEQYYSEANGQTIYKLAGCVVNTAGIDFDIDGITTINWSGFGNTITQLDASEPVDFKTPSEDTLGRPGTTSTTNFLRNRIASLSVVPVAQDFDGNTSTGAVAGAIQNFTVTTGLAANALDAAVPGNYNVKVGTGSVVSSGGGAAAEFAVRVKANGSVTVSMTKAGSGFILNETITIPGATGFLDNTNTAVNQGTQDVVITVASTANGISAAGDDFQDEYDLILTGGSINLENNITFITPEELCRVNTPIGHITGARTVSGSFTCYLNDDASSGDNKSAAFFRDLTAATGATRNKFALAFTVGSVGTATTDQGVKFEFPTAHIDIPTHQIEDVISLETNFHGLPSSLTGADEVTITYKGK